MEYIFGFIIQIAGIMLLAKLSWSLLRLQKWTPTVGHISSFLKWLTQLMLRIFAYRSRPHQE